MGVCGSRPKVVQLDVPRQVSTTDQWLMRPTECMGGAAQVSPYAATLPASYPYRALARVALRVGDQSAATSYLLAALFEAVGPAACADHCTRGCRAALEAALAAGLDPPAALRRAARDLDAAFLADASLPAWLRACSGATMSAVLLPCDAESSASDDNAAATTAAGRRVYAARLGAPPPLVARARGAFSNTTVECVVLQGGEGAPKSPTRAGCPTPRANGVAASPAGAAAGSGAAAGPPASDPHDGLTLVELLQQPPKQHKQGKHPEEEARICVRAIGLGYGKDAQLARAWRERCRRGGRAPEWGGAAASDSHPRMLLAPPDQHLPESFIRCEPEVTAHALAPGDAAVVLASAALRAALPPAELALLAHGFDARRLSALRLAYTAGKAPLAEQSFAAAGWSGVDDCGGARLALARKGPAAAAEAAAAAKGRGGPAATASASDASSSDLAALPPLAPAPVAPRGEPNAARILVHVARARLLAAANRAASAAAAAAPAAAPIGGGGRPLPKLLAKRVAAQPLAADDATRLDLAVDGEELALALERQRQQQKKKKGAKAAAAAATFDDGTDFAAAPVLALPPGYGSVPPAAYNGAQQQQQEEQEEQREGAGGHHAETAAETATAAAAAGACCTKRDVHGDLAAVVLALEWGGRGAHASASNTATTKAAAVADRPPIHLAASASSLSGRAAAVQAALAVGSRSSRPAALYRWELVRLAVKVRCARRRQLRAAWWVAADALRRAADAAAREAEVAAWRVLGEAVHVTRGGDVVASAAAPAAAAAGGASGARAVVMLGMGGSAKGPAAAAAAAAAASAHSLRRHYHQHRASPSLSSPSPSPSPLDRR